MKTQLGIASYNNPDKLQGTLDSIRQNTTGEWECLIVDNNSTEERTKDIIRHYAQLDSRFKPVFQTENGGYASAVNEILRWATEHYITYCDNDAVIKTKGWNEIVYALFEQHHDVGMVFPGTYVSYPIKRQGYTEILWGTGCFWTLNTARITDVGYFDEEIGHQEEVDYQMRMRLAGWKIGCTDKFQIRHFSTASTNPAAQERINKGVINWVNKWNAYFVGPQTNYHSWNVTRFEDWMASYLEEWYLSKPQFQGLNADPEQITVDGRTYDLIKVPRHPHLYRDRII